jgi:hypothetical protein
MTDRAQALEVDLTINLSRTEFQFTLKATRAALGLIILVATSILLQANAHVAAHTLLCTYLACSPQSLVSSRQLFS